MQRFQIEVCPRVPRDKFAPWFHVDADTEQAAIDEAIGFIRDGHPGKNLSDYIFKAVRIPPCRRCGGELVRVPRRLVDRLFSPGRHRYQCNWAECDWVGNLSIEGTSSIWFFLVRGFAAASIAVVVASVGLSVFTIHRDRVTAEKAQDIRAKTPSMVRTQELPPRRPLADRDRKEAPAR